MSAYRSAPNDSCARLDSQRGCRIRTSFHSLTRASHRVFCTMSRHICRAVLFATGSKARKLPPDEAVKIAVEVGTGLDYAHRNGFVHRDVKPENILFADGHALLADFGIAHVSLGSRTASRSPRRHCAWHSGVHESRAGVGADRHRHANRHLRTRLRALRDAVRSPAVQGIHCARIMAKHVTENPKPLRTLRPEVSGARRACHCARSRESAGAAIRIDRGIHRGASQPQSDGARRGANGRTQRCSASIRERISGSGQRVSERRNHG